MITQTREFSFSRLRTHRECPRQFDFRYNQKLEAVGAPAPELARGTAFHRLAHLYLAHCRKEGVHTDITEARPLALRALEETRAPESVRTEVLDLAATFAENMICPLDGSLYLEAEFGGEIEGIPFRGFLDYCHHAEDGTITVRDFKTDWQIRSQGAVDSDPQLDLYALLAWLELSPDLVGEENREILVELDFVRYGVVRSSTRSSSTLAEVAQRVVEEAAAIETATEFPATIGDACSRCPFTAHCEAFTAACEAGEVLVGTEDQAIEVARRMVALERHLGDIKDALKAWTSTNGPIGLPGLEVGFSKRESFKYPLEKLVPILKEHDLPVLDFAQADTTAVKRLLKNEAIRPALEEIRIDASSSTFGSRKAKGDGR